MIRVAQFSDIHYAGATLQEVDRCFTFAVDDAIKQGVACAVISGDSTDHALDVHAPAVDALARNIRRLADHCPVLMLQGTFSHEPPGTLNVFRLLGGKYPVHVADTIQQIALMPDGSWLASERWCFEEIPVDALALFSCVPTVNKAVIAAAVGAINAAQSVGEELASLLKGFAPINAAARNSGIPTIGVSHGTVYGCTTEHGVPMAGFDHEFTTATLFSAQTSAFMLGHIHKHQSWMENERVIAYPGSIGRLHYGEEGDKGFLIWEVDATAARFKLVDTPAKRTVEITFDGLPNLEVLQEQVERLDIEGAYVRVRWTAPEEDRHQVDRAAITETLRGAASVKLEGRIVPVVRTRAAGISRDAAITAKIATWAIATEAKTEPLLACLEALQISTPEAIATRFIQHSTNNWNDKHDSKESLSRGNERGLSQDSMEALTLF